jgi:methyl-accepting chemotaxis protein
MAGNPRDVNLDIVGHDRTGNATRSAGSNLDKLRRKVDDVNDSNGKLEKGAKKSLSGMAESFKEAAATIRSAGPVAAVAAIGAGIVVLPQIAAAASVGIVGALGGGLAFIGLKFAAMNKEVRSSWSRTKDHVVSRLREMSKPFEPVLIHISKLASKTFDSFAPALSKAFGKMAPVVDRFAVDLASSLEGLKPAIGPLVNAFDTLVRKIGTKLPSIMRAVAGAITDISSAIADNPGAIDSLADGFVKVVRWTGRAISWLTRMSAAYGYLNSSVELFTAQVGLNAAKVHLKIATMVANVVNAMSKLPGPLGAPFRKMQQSANAAVRRAQSDFNSLKTREAQAEVEHLNNKIKFLKGKKVKTDVDRAAIAQAQARIRQLQGSINSVHGKTVTINVKLKGDKVGGAGAGGGGGGGSFAAGTSWAAVSGGHLARTGGPTAVTVTAGPTTVDARVFLDSRELTSVIRTTVNDEMSRQARRARTGRR